MATQPQHAVLGSYHLVLLLELFLSNCFNTPLNSHLAFLIKSRLYQLHWQSSGRQKKQVLPMLRYLLATRALHPQATGLSLKVISGKPCEKLPESIRRASASAIALREDNQARRQHLVSVLPLLNSGLDFSARGRGDPPAGC